MQKMVDFDEHQRSCVAQPFTLLACLRTGKARAAPKPSVAAESESSDETEEEEDTDASNDSFELDDDADDDDIVDNDDSTDEEEDNSRIRHGRGKRTQQERKRSHAKPAYNDWLKAQYTKGKDSYEAKIEFARFDIMGYLLQRQAGMQRAADIALGRRV
eukprot:m.75596 g.75596  ORF g.75596 m.75596 type:complete len:159 (-) comp14407_c0_seq11:1455-1931(-)